MPAVADAGEIVEQREIGHLVAQPVHRHQQETEIPGHRQEHQDQDQNRLDGVELGERELGAEMQEIARHANGKDPDDQDRDGAGEPGTGTDAAVLPRQH